MTAIKPSPVPAPDRYNLVKQRVNEVLDHPDKNDRRAMAVQVLLAATIVINTIAIVIFTVPEIGEIYGHLLNPLISFCIAVFAVEYVLRLWSCTRAPRWKRRALDRLSYALQFYLIIDLISIIPIFFPFMFPQHVALLRLVRLISIFKLGRYTRYSESLALFRRVLVRKKEIFVIMVFFLVFIILFSSTLLYLVENPVQPKAFSSIPAAMWWSIMTVTTVGYGDIIPITPLGRALAGLFTLSGILVLALPSAILASGFIEEREKKRENARERNRDAIMEKVRRMHGEGRITDEDRAEFEALAGGREREFSGKTRAGR